MTGSVKSGWPYEALTGEIRVRVRPTYLQDYSDPDERRYVWAYDIEIANLGLDTVQLLSRHWVITDALGRVEEVRGPGVVGEQPTLRPGESHAYTSGCPLTTASGSMVGSYQMTDGQGRLFEVAIPAFSLDAPDARRVLN